MVYESRARRLACAGAIGKHSPQKGLAEGGYFNGSGFSAGSWKLTGRQELGPVVIGTA